jgi:DNA-binding HxlR family transcriptional regulator
MPINKKIVELEGQRGTLQILLALQQNGEILYGNLYNNKSMVEISNNSTAKRALDLLQKHGLIVQRPFEGKRAIYYRLSKKGEQFARLINEMESILQ